MKKKNKRQSQVKEIWRRIRKNKPAVGGLIVFGILCFLAIFGQMLIPLSQSTDQNISIRLQDPSFEHILGTDGYGRDQFARIIHGARSSISIGVGTSLFALLVGSMIGACSAFYGGRTDNILMRLIDILASTPPMLLAMILVATLGTNMINLMLSIGIAGIPTFSRLARATMMTIIDQDYIVAARTYGTPNLRIMVKHIIPNAMGPLIVQATISIADNILTAASLSYIGLGIQPPAPEWGALLNAGREYLQAHAYLILYPGIALMLAALSISLLGDGLRDALDPRLKT